MIDFCLASSTANLASISSSSKMVGTKRLQNVFSGDWTKLEVE